MSILFQPVQLGCLSLANRFVRSATWEGMASPKGDCTPELIRTMEALAAGEVGLIITGHTYVTPAGQAGIRQLGIYEDRLIGGLRQMTDSVHEQGGKIAVQLAHAGIFADSELTGLEPVGPSVVSTEPSRPMRNYSLEEIPTLVKAFGQAARRAKEAGFDAVQLHAAHGYLLSQFLSPYFNHRTDRYGGDIQGRSTLPVEVIQEVRKQVGEDFPILAKMNCQDFIQGGQELGDALAAAVAMACAGLDAVEISGGTGLSGKFHPVRTGIREVADEAYFKDAAKAFRAELSIPVLLVGGIRSFPVAEGLVEEGAADLISLSRPLIREPNLVKRWRAGDRRPAACRSDNRCFIPARSGEGIYCVMAKKQSLS